jgi:hypothetical protein
MSATDHLVTLADAVRDAHAEYLFRFYGRSTISNVTAAKIRLDAAKKSLRAAWLNAPAWVRLQALAAATKHAVKCGGCPHAAVSSRERLEDLINLPTPAETP